MKKMSYVLAAVLALCLMMTGCGEERRFEKAQRLMDEESYAQAAALFEKLGDYENSAALAGECRDHVQYEEATAFLSAGDYQSAQAAFAELGSFGDAEVKARFCENMALYTRGVSLMQSGDYADAYVKFYILGTFEDSKVLLEKCGLYILHVWDADLDGDAISGSATFDKTYSRVAVDVYIDLDDEETFVGTARASEIIGDVKAGQAYEFSIPIDKFAYCGTFFNAVIRSDGAQVTYPDLSQGSIRLELRTGDTVIGRYEVKATA